MSINPVIMLAKIVSEIEETQISIADIESRMEATLLGNTQEDQTQLRLVLSQLKALLGTLRPSETFWKDEILAALQDRNKQGELAKA